MLVACRFHTVKQPSSVKATSFINSFTARSSTTTFNAKSSLNGKKGFHVNSNVTSKTTDTLTVTSNSDGVFRICIPSANNEKISFSLRGEDSVRNFLRDLKEEDNLIQSVALYDPEGARISQSTAINDVVKALPSFKLKINNKEYNVISAVPNTTLGKVGHIGIASSELEEIKKEFVPLYLQKKELDTKAHRVATGVIYAGLGYLVAQWAVMARFTWWEFNWDIMEPITYFVTFGTAIIGYIYFVATKREYTFPDLHEAIAVGRMKKYYSKSNFDVDKYFELEHKLKKLDEESLADIQEQVEHLQERPQDVALVNNEKKATHERS